MQKIAHLQVPVCPSCNLLMTLQDTRPNEPSNGVDSLVYHCEPCYEASASPELSRPSSNHLDISLDVLQTAANRAFKHFKGGVEVSAPYWIDPESHTLRVGIGYGTPDSSGARPGSFGANYNYLEGRFL